MERAWLAVTVVILQCAFVVSQPDSNTNSARHLRRAGAYPRARPVDLQYSTILQGLPLKSNDSDNLKPLGEVVHRQIRETIQPYSALRDPVEGKVRVFFDAESWIAATFSACHFARGAAGAPGWNASVDGRKVPGELFGLTATMRRSDGYMLVCEDPGPEFDQLLITSDEHYTRAHRLHLLNITTVAVNPDGGVGICAGPLYSQRETYEQWIHDSLAAGVDAIHVYHTSVRDSGAGSFFYGLRYGVTANQFAAVPHPQVHYYYFEPPSHRYYFGQVTLLNECIYRNRHAHKYLIMADVDEFLHLPALPSQDAPPPLKLKTLLDQWVPPDAAGLLVDTLWYTLQCQTSVNVSLLTGVQSLVSTCHLFDPNGGRFRNPKSIVRPSAVKVFHVHDIKELEKGFKRSVRSDTSLIYIKHLRLTGSVCDVHIDARQHWIDDSDVDAFRRFVSSAL